MHLFFFEGWRRGLIDKEAGYPSNYRFLTFKAIFSEVCVLYFELKLKFTQIMRFLRKIIITVAKNVVFESSNSSFEVW